MKIANKTTKSIKINQNHRFNNAKKEMPIDVNRKEKECEKNLTVFRKFPTKKINEQFPTEMLSDLHFYSGVICCSSQFAGAQLNMNASAVYISEVRI